ncbi:MAG: hypothetical protein ACTSP3_00115 [Candidatus Heimdallarchaeaceae archaeon]
MNKNLKSSIVLVDQGIDNDLKRNSLKLRSLFEAERAYKYLKERTKYIPNEISAWKYQETVIKRTPTYRKNFLAKRTDKFDKEIKYWYK